MIPFLRFPAAVNESKHTAGKKANAPDRGPNSDGQNDVAFPTFSEDVGRVFAGV
jgi:hypothetical protein